MWNYIGTGCIFYVSPHSTVGLFFICSRMRQVLHVISKTGGNGGKGTGNEWGLKRNKCYLFIYYVQMLRTDLCIKIKKIYFTALNSKAMKPIIAHTFITKLHILILLHTI